MLNFRKRKKGREMDKFIEWAEAGMQELGFSPADLSRRSGLSKSTLSHILNGDRQPGAKVAIAIATALGRPPEEGLRKANIMPDKFEDRQEAKDLLDYFEEEEFDLIWDFMQFMKRRQDKRRPG